MDADAFGERLHGAILGVVQGETGWADQMAQRAADRLNAVREGPAKSPVVLWFADVARPDQTHETTPAPALRPRRPSRDPERRMTPGVSC
jgi:hypothetical protein